LSIIKELEAMAGLYHDGPRRITAVTELCHRAARELAAKTIRVKDLEEGIKGHERIVNRYWHLYREMKKDVGDDWTVGHAKHLLIDLETLGQGEREEKDLRIKDLESKIEAQEQKQKQEQASKEIEMINEFRGFKIKAIIGVPPDEKQWGNYVIQTEPCNDDPNGHQFEKMATWVLRWMPEVGDYIVAVNGADHIVLGQDFAKRLVDA